MEQEECLASAAICSAVRRRDSNCMRDRFISSGILCMLPDHGRDSALRNYHHCIQTGTSSGRSNMPGSCGAFGTSGYSRRSCLALIVIAILAEAIRPAFKYIWTGDVISTVIMSFSTFGYYGQIWFNRTYTYECAIEEMPVGYADTLMAMSPPWSLPAVIVIGIILSIAVSNLTAKLFKLER